MGWRRCGPGRGAWARGAGPSGAAGWAASRCRPPRIQVLPEPVEVVGRVARVWEALQLRVEREALADLDPPPGHARIEPVERAHRRAALDLSLEAVDAAVARTDELLRGLDVAHRTAEVGAARGNRDVGRIRALALDPLVLLRIVLAQVDGRLAGVADLRHQTDHLRHVGLVVEVVLGAHVLPAFGLLLLEQRSDRKAECGQRDRRHGHPAHELRAALHEAPPGDGLALERPGEAATLGVAGLLVELGGISHLCESDSEARRRLVPTWCRAARRRPDHHGVRSLSRVGL